MSIAPSPFLDKAKPVKILGRSPIIYDMQVEVRFGDLDPYGHVNAKNYLDYVGSARLRYLEHTLNMPVAKITDAGVGFFLKKATQFFKRPITGLTQVRCLSFVHNVERATFMVLYSLEDGHGKVFSEGTLDYVVADIRKGGSMEPPSWLYDVFLEKAAVEQGLESSCLGVNK